MAVVDTRDFVYEVDLMTTTTRAVRIAIAASLESILERDIRYNIYRSGFLSREILLVNRCDDYCLRQ